MGTGGKQTVCLSLAGLLQFASGAVGKHLSGVGVNGGPVVRQSESAGHLFCSKVPHFNVGVADQGRLHRRGHYDPRGLVGGCVDMQTIPHGDVAELGNEGSELLLEDR